MEVCFKHNNQINGMNMKTLRNVSGSPRVEVGEIDTSAPFQSVKDAVNLFGEDAFSGEKPSIKKGKPHSAERTLLTKETELHRAQKELNKLKEQIENAESTKAQALSELQNAQKMVEDLNHKLKTITESRESAIKETENANTRAKRLEVANSEITSGTDDSAWKQDLEAARGHYMTAVSEIDTAKKELGQIRHDRDGSLEAKVMALKLVADANQGMKANMERATEISKEISDVQESIRLVKLASLQAQQEQANVYAEKDIQRQSHKATMEDLAKKLLDFKKEFDPALTRNLELQLAGTAAEIGNLQKEMENARASDLDSVKSISVELDDAKETLHRVVEEESFLQRSVGSLKLELENVRREHSELKEKEAETESIAGSLHVKLRKSQSELEACLAEESKARGATDELITTLHQISLETKNSRQEAEELKMKAEELQREAEAAKSALKEAEEKLRIAAEESEQAKAAEARALSQIQVLSERIDAARSSTSESGAKITISTEEFEALNHKVEESDLLAELKVAAAKAQVEAVKASENEAQKRLEATFKDIADMKTATDEALKRAEMAEAAKRAVEGELRRWHEREQKAAETASRILVDVKMSSEWSPQQSSIQKQNLLEQQKAAKTASWSLEDTKAALESSPQQHKVQRQNLPEKIIQGQKLEKKISIPKKSLLPNLSGIFRRKKNQVEGSCPSYLPGEHA